MDAFEQLQACAGRWEATYQLRGPEDRFCEDAPSVAVVTPLLRGRFVQIAYSWSYRDAAQEGALLVGRDRDVGCHTVAWMDSWHNSDRMMLSSGALGETDRISVLGSYPAPPGPDWGWRTELGPTAGSLVVEMFNITPAGEEMLAVRAAYHRLPSSKDPGIVGLGGVFVTAENPTRLALWYRDHLGLQITGTTPEPPAFAWRHVDDPQRIGTTVWAAFPRDSEYLGRGRFMVNYRVANLDRLVARLASLGTPIASGPVTYPNGRFAWIQDPEGNRVELWEPAAGY